MQYQIPYTRPPPVCSKYPVPSQSTQLSLPVNSIGYDKILCENNLQLTELQFYINNIIMCQGIVALLSESKQDHQLNTLIKCSTPFTSLLSSNHNNI